MTPTLLRLVRWCARWAGGALLLSLGLAQPPPLDAQSNLVLPQRIPVLLHYAPLGRTDTVIVAPGYVSRVDVWVFRDSSHAVVGCVLARMTDGTAAILPFGARLVGDTLRPFVGASPICDGVFRTYVASP